MWCTSAAANENPERRIGPPWALNGTTVFSVLFFFFLLICQLLPLGLGLSATLSLPQLLPPMLSIQQLVPAFTRLIFDSAINEHLIVNGFSMLVILSG